MRSKATIITFIVLSIICLSIFFLQKFFTSTSTPVSTHNKEDVSITPDVTPMFISLRFQNVSSKTIEGIGNITPEKFEEIIKYLDCNNYHFMSANEVYDFVMNKVTVPEKSVWLTFDGGWESAHTYATPILQKYKARATEFVTISLIKDQNKLTNNQLKNMNKSGVWDIQTQGYTGNRDYAINAKGKVGNFYLYRLWQIDHLESVKDYKDRIKKDLKDAFANLKDNYNSQQLIFSYPFKENISLKNDSNQTVRYFFDCLDELKIIGLGTQIDNRIINNFSIGKHLISRFDVNEYTDLETILSLNYSGQRLSFSNPDGNVIKFSNITKYDNENFITWNNNGDFLFLNSLLQPISKPVNISSKLGIEKQSMLATTTENGQVIIVAPTRKVLLFVNSNWILERKYAPTFTPVSLWSNGAFIYLLDTSGIIYKFSNKPYRIAELSISPISKASAFGSILYVFDDEKKTISIYNYKNNKLIATKSYPRKYSLIPQFCTEEKKIIVFEANRGVFAKLIINFF